MKASWFGFLLMLALVSHARADIVTGSMVHGGITRNWIAHLPSSYAPGASVPLVVGLHPAFSNGSKFQSSSGWDAKSEAKGFIVVYPNGGESAGSGGNFTWNSFDFSGSAPDDLGFLGALIDRFHGDYNIDTRRVFMTGFSNGAMMTNSFAAVHADKVAAIAPVSGGWITAYGGSESSMNPTESVPTWIWRGANENFTTGTGSSARPRNVQDQEQKAFWIDKNQATFESTLVENLNYGIPRTYTTEKYSGNAPVWFTEVSGSGHVYQPGAADLIWDRFFSIQGVPEPGSILLVLSALALGKAVGRRRLTIRGP